jgi:hypothetical protein
MSGGNPITQRAFEEMNWLEFLTELAFRKELNELTRKD